MRLASGLLVLAVACHHGKPAQPVKPLSRAAYAHYLAGKTALFGGDAQEAAEQLALAAQAAPDQPMIAVEEARALVRAKRANEAAQVLADARKKWPGHAQVWLASAEVAEAAKEASASAAYRKTIELAPDDERGYLGLARTLEAAHDTRGAEAALHALVKRVPASVDGHYRLAKYLQARDERATAMTELRAVLERDPDHIDARLELARLLRRTGNITEAVAQTRSAFDRAGQSLDIAEELFWLLCESDDLTGAVDLLTLLDDDRSDAEALLAVARLDIALHRTDEALAIGQRIAAQDAGAQIVIRTAVAVANRDPAEAESWATKLAEDSRYFFDVRRLAAEAWLASGDPQHALGLVEPLHRAKPDELEIALVMAFALADLNRADDARAVIDAVKTDADRRRLAHARLAEHRGDLKSAIALLEAFLVGHPDNATIANLAGYLLVQSHERLDDAEKYLKRARELSPGDPAILDSWGWLRLARGDTRGALAALEHAARFAPFEPEILLHLASAYAAAGNAQKAAETLDRATAMKPYPDVARRIAALRSTLAPGR